MGLSSSWAGSLTRVPANTWYSDPGSAAETITVRSFGSGEPEMGAEPSQEGKPGAEGVARSDRRGTPSNLHPCERARIRRSRSVVSSPFVAWSGLILRPAAP